MAGGRELPGREGKRTYLDALDRPPPRHRPAALGCKPPQNSGQSRGGGSHLAAEEAFETWRNSQRAQVREALQMLPPEQLKVLELAYFSGYTHTETAELLALPLGTVKDRMRLGLKKIQEHFGSRGMEAPE